ncbi:MAG: ribosome recycling factor [Fimbriimonadaceae bacterium]|nr:ribosome recycling factor [Fimbriimonadaceae bacterium]
MSEATAEVLLEAEDHMEKTVKATEHEFSLVRTGRASPALVEEIKVDYHGTPTALQQLAMIRAPEARLLTIEPWEKGLIRAIEKALADARLGLNPQNDGKLIRIGIPPLTEERRRELAKGCQHTAEKGRVAVRNVRREAIDHLRKMEKEGAVSEDELHRGQDDIQKLTDQYIAKIDKLVKAKEEELMSE